MKPGEADRAGSSEENVPRTTERDRPGAPPHTHAALRLGVLSQEPALTDG